MTSHRPPLLLSGFMGTGKTTVGRIVAERAGVPFLDLDEAIAAEAGRSIEAIFAQEGEPAFRALEASALRRALDAPAPGVVALGGGALLDPQSRRAALDRARIVVLTARPETIARRTSSLASSRPLLAGAADLEARTRQLLADRAAVYAEAHGHLATDDRTPDQTADAVLRLWSDPALVVLLGARSYPVRIAAHPEEALVDALAALDPPPSAVFLVTDVQVGRLWSAPLQSALEARGLRPAATVVLTPGEQSKRLSVVEDALSAMVAAGADRDAVLVAHGGGVVSDVAGFAAATLYRGVRWVAVPTTLLAMVDAAVGGKTGVDLGAAKNAAGAIHQPSAVLIGPGYVATESPRAYVSGLAEVVKSACIGDARLFDLLEREREPDRVLARAPDLAAAMIERSVAVKVGIVCRDERETGDRALLNFGHTLGHALESQGGFERLTHGEAVSLGMVAALRAGCELGVTSPDTTARVTRLLARLGLPVDLAREPVADALRFLALDKKRRGASIRAVLLRGIGEPLIHRIPLDALADLFARVAAHPLPPA